MKKVSCRLFFENISIIFRILFVAFVSLDGTCILAKADDQSPAKAGSAPGPETLLDLALLTEAYPVSGVLLGQGWNSVISQKTPGICVTGVEHPIPGNAATLNYTYLLDKEQLLNSMSISASGSFSAGVGGGSLSASFNQSLQVDTSKTNIVATVIADKGGIQLSPELKNGGAASNITFSDEAMKLLKSGKTVEFKQLCGDGFVASRRDGGRLDLVFELSDDQRTKIEQLSVAASGHYAGASGGASFNQSHKDILTNDKTNVKQLQQGGDLTMALTPADAVTKIENFATFAPEKSHPYQITVISYRAIQGFPSDSRFLSFFKLRSYLAHSLRLADISNIYSDAALNPQNYYFPFEQEKDFTSRTLALMSVANSASTASICLDKFITYCSTTGNCSLQDVLQLPEFRRACDVLTKNQKKPSGSYSDFSEKRLAFNLLVGLPQESRNAEGQAASAVSSSGDQKTALSKFYAPKLVANEDSKAEEMPSPYWTYMRLLANSPLKRNRPPGNIGSSLPGDQLEDIRKLCINKSIDGKCEHLASDKLILEDDSQSSPAAQDFRDWVLKFRLYPLSQTFCEISRSHPMCFETQELFNLAFEETKVFFGKNRNFDVAANPIPPTKPKPEPVDRMPKFR